MSGVDITGEVAGLEILQLTETAGLGMKAYDDYFLKQFFGQSGSISVVKNKRRRTSDTGVDGATITSVAVAGAVNRALALYAQVSGTAEEPTPGLPTVVRFGEPFAVELDGNNTYECRKGFNDADEVVAYDFVTAAQGHRDLVKVRTAVDINGVVTGVELLEINDTPAYSDGAKAAGFLNQYIGKSGTIGVVTSDPGDNEVQALTGATRTTNGFTEAVNIALKLYESVAGGDNNG
jgi:Na+-translocating ferredoxin:NAD+ oxidoreductase RnfG subunit